MRHTHVRKLLPLQYKIFETDTLGSNAPEVTHSWLGLSKLQTANDIKNVRHLAATTIDNCRVFLNGTSAYSMSGEARLPQDKSKNQMYGDSNPRRIDNSARHYGDPVFLGLGSLFFVFTFFLTQNRQNITSPPRPAVGAASTPYLKCDRLREGLCKQRRTLLAQKRKQSRRLYLSDTMECIRYSQRVP